MKKISSYLTKEVSRCSIFELRLTNKFSQLNSSNIQFICFVFLSTRQ